MNEEKKNQVATSENKIPSLGEGGYLPIGEEAKMISHWAKYVAASPYYKSMGGEAAVVSIWLTARELGIPVMSALNGSVYFVQGKIMLSASCMSMLIRKAGHSIQKVDHTDKICKLRGKRKDNGDTAESTFTIENANRAGLIKSGGVWAKFPERMLFNRAISNLAKDLFSDCIGSAYVEGEIETIDITESSASSVENAEPMNEETLQFIIKFDIDNKESKASAFIDYIAERTRESRSNTIVNTSKDQVAFEANLKKFEKK